MEDPIEKSNLSFRTKFFYGFGSISFGIKNNGFSYFVLFVYSSVFGLPAWMAGMALNLILVADAITDPLVGYSSDRLRSKWGRRHPFMYAAAIPVAFTFYFFLIQSRCRGGTQPHTDLMHFVAATIFTFTIHSQRVVRLGHCASERRVGECCWDRKSSKVRMRRGIAPMRGPPLAGKFGAVFPV